MYAAVKQSVLRWLRAPAEPPDPPAGSHASIEVFRASPRFLSYRLAVFWIGWSLSWLGWWSSLIVPAFIAEAPQPLVVAAILAPLQLIAQLVTYLALRVDYDLRYYIVTDRSLRVREGALVVKEKTLSYANIQNLRIAQGPLLRLFGIWNLEVDTAGGGGRGRQGKKQQGIGSHSLRMAGIADAQAVRDRILAHLRRHGAGSGLGDLDDDDSAAGTSPGLLAALGEVRAAASALRATAEGLRPGGT